VPTLWTPRNAEDLDALLIWAERLLSNTSFDRARALPIGVMHGDAELVAVAVYSERRGANIEMSIAADTPRWATRHVIGQLLSYPFTVFGCRRITAVVREDNARSRRLVGGMGFKHEGTMRDAFEGADAMIFGLTKHDWAAGRWHCRLLQEAA
jgi:RimJ/RimL family protein N-acetyltransferase